MTGFSAGLVIVSAIRDLSSSSFAGLALLAAHFRFS
jgi:hypothetical protein